MTTGRSVADRKKASNLRFETLNAFVDRGIAEAGLSPASIAVWLVLYRHGKPDGSTEIPVDFIAQQSGLSRSTVLRSLAELRAASMLKTTKKGGIGRGANRYILAPYPMRAPTNVSRVAH
jgi:predicted transcriptional regulator